MQSRLSDLVRAFLPLLPLALCPGCGDGSSDAGAVANAGNSPVVAPGASANRAPTIAGEAQPLAKVGQPYSFTPVVADPDGDALTFSATNLPPWAQIDAHTGAIRGTPANSDIGNYESISISVADASHHVMSHDFSIVVSSGASGVASLRWAAPFLKVDGTHLDNLAGYRILYGRDPEELDHSVFIADPAARSYEFATLDAGAWYFAIVAVNDQGLEGPATTPAMKVI